MLPRLLCQSDRKLEHFALAVLDSVSWDSHSQDNMQVQSFLPHSKVPRQLSLAASVHHTEKVSFAYALAWQSVWMKKDEEGEKAERKTFDLSTR